MPPRSRLFFSRVFATSLIQIAISAACNLIKVTFKTYFHFVFVFVPEGLNLIAALLIHTEYLIAFLFLFLYFLHGSQEKLFVIWNWNFVFVFI